MKRKEFLEKGLAAGAALGASGYLGSAHATGFPDASDDEVVDLEKYRFHPHHRFSNDELVIDREKPGRPHEGKVLAAIQPHSDDIPLFAGGTVAKLIHHAVPI